ncbi:MAG: sensor histidine kinase [Anaerolineae bacterium]
MAVRTRLAVWYTIVTAGILILYLLLSLALLRAQLLHQVDRQLAEHAIGVRDALLQRADFRQAVDEGRIRLPAVPPGASPVYLQVVRGNESVAARSPNLIGWRLPLDMDLVAINVQGHAGYKTVITDEGTPLRLYSLPLMDSGRMVGAVQAGYLLVDIEHTLQRTWTTLAIGGVLVLLVLGVAGWWLASLALRPMDHITQQALQIASTHDLRQRLPLPRVRDETYRLVSTFNALLDRLARVIEAQQRLSADVSHELRTPLTTIHGNVALLRRGAMDDAQERKIALDAIEAEVNRMSRLVADLLLLAQADAGMQLEKQLVEMDTLLLEVYRQAQAMAAVGSGGVGRVAVRLGHEDQALVLGDPDRLRQLLLNLVDNAIKYTPRGGTITLSLCREEGWVRVSVQDTGVGIPPEALPHIFERFFRMPRQGRKGVGLGLAIARWIAEAHGGRLEVESQVGQGSTFTLWLPEAQELAPS